MIYVEDRLIPEKTDSFAVLPQHIYNKGKQHKGVVMTTKVCSRCKKEKPLESFHRQSCNKDGRRYECSECSSKYSKDRYKDIPSELNIYRAMKQRCLNPNSHAAKNYHFRGISVCDRWLDSYDNFMADMGPRPSNKHELDRRDNDGNYCPENCRWVLPVVNARNSRACKLNTKKASEIKRLISIGLKDSFLGLIYGVSTPTISDIRMGRTWADVK